MRHTETSAAFVLVMPENGIRTSYLGRFRLSDSRPTRSRNDVRISKEEMISPQQTKTENKEGRQ
jgi:hypothetical protein